MKQLTQKLKNGKMEIKEVVVPPLQKGTVLVRNYYSLISAGTEGSTVKTARKGYIGKAKERPQQVKQVIDTLMTQGPVQTYRAVMKKLESYSPLGYSCVGEVIEIADDINEFAVGDMVACAGLSASHAEVVCVPVNLCVSIPKSGSNDTDRLLKNSAYNTLGAIAMQGVRQADLRLGETCVVIGLGLLGQISALLLKASGVNVVGVDIDETMVDIAKNNCLDLALNRNENGIEDKILQFTNGIGCDAVIIAAASSSLDPINFAGAISRKRGSIIILGAVPTGFDREPYFYKKELQVKMSCSYGPGRYDPVYEEKGIDYPVAYVRWTEKRNMQAFQELIATKKIDLSYLTTHIFDLENAPSAYDMMMNKSESFIGILIKYDVSKKIDRNNNSLSLKTQNPVPALVSLAFIGAGSYAQSHLLPNIPKTKNVSFKGVLTATSTSSRSVAERFGFEFCTGEENDILEKNDINTIFIATRHGSHADYVIKALNQGKNVFVEKPLCLTLSELEQIKELYNNSTHIPQLMVGYNRRFSPLVQKLKSQFKEGTMAMNYRINSGTIPKDSWIQDMETGGGRTLGEVCHFVDLLTFINGSLLVSVYATAMDDPENLNDVINISLKYQNGSIGNISYYANGDKSLPKEYLEVFANGCTAIIDDFRVLSIYANGKKKIKKLISQDKGQKNEVKLFLGSIINGSESVIPFNEIYNTSLTTFKILESIQKRECIEI